MALVWYYHRYEHDTPGIDYLEQNRVKCTCKVGRSSVEGSVNIYFQLYHLKIPRSTFTRLRVTTTSASIQIHRLMVYILTQQLHIIP